MRVEDLTVITPCISYANEEPLWMFMTTCRRFGITPTFYGKGATYGGWVDIMLRRLMEAARTCPTSHMLYTDSGDAFFLAGLDEITEKYNAMGCPPLMYGADCVGFPSYQTFYDKVPWDMTKAFPYFQMGGKIGEAKVIYEAIRWMFEQCDNGRWADIPGDDPAWWCNFMVERPGELTIDHDCEIFQNCTNCAESLTLDLGLEERGFFKRLCNGITHSQPCILHFNGGYTDQITGKWYAMEKTWRALGYTENPPWEGK